MASWCPLLSGTSPPDTTRYTYDASTASWYDGDHNPERSASELTGSVASNQRVEIITKAYNQNLLFHTCLSAASHHTNSDFVATLYGKFPLWNQNPRGKQSVGNVHPVQCGSAVREVVAVKYPPSPLHPSSQCFWWWSNGRHHIYISQTQIGVVVWDH